MIEFKIKSAKVIAHDEGQVLLDLMDKKSIHELNKDFNGYTCTLKKKKEKSLNANAYMWVLCDKIAKKIHATKIDVYKKAIRDIGIFFDVTVEAEREEEFTRCWESNGIGWFCEGILATSQATQMRCYKGSSVYDGSEMSRLIEYVVEEAKGLGIETLTPLEIARLNSLWESK